MQLVTPGIGLIFWMTLSFGILFLILKKFAWKPILEMLAEREKSIETALNAAEKAKEELRELNTINEKLLKEAKVERDNMLKEAREMKEQIIKEAKDKAKAEADKLISNAHESIRSEKSAAINELKQTVANLSIEIAEKILRSELTNEERQKALTSGLINDIKLN